MAAERSIFDTRGRIVDRLVKRVLTRVAKRVVQQLKSTAPVSVGRQGPFGRGDLPGSVAGTHLKDTFSYRIEGDTITIVSTAPHFLPIVDGSVGHPIDAVKAERLVFPVPFRKRKAIKPPKKGRRKKGPGRKSLFSSGGEVTVAVKHVFHPGHRANKFFARVQRDIPKILREELREVTSE